MPFRTYRLVTRLVCAALLIAPQANAEEFSWQIGAGGSDSELGQSAAGESATLSGTYFFGPVDDADGPYALAPFLERASRIGASYHEDKTTSRSTSFVFAAVPVAPRPPLTIVTRASGRSLSGRYVSDDAGWYVGASLAEADAAHPAPLPTSFDVLGDDLRSRSVSLGKYLGRATAIELSLEAADASLRSELFLPCSGLFCTVLSPATITMTLETEVETAQVSALHVGRLGKMHYSLSGGVASNKADATREVVVTPAPAPSPLPPPILSPPFAGGIAVPSPSLFTSSERRERYELVGELFPTQALGLRVGFARWDGAPALDERYELGATWFFKRRIGAEVVFARATTGLPISTALDVDTATLRFIGRL